MNNTEEPPQGCLTTRRCFVELPHIPKTEIAILIFNETYLVLTNAFYPSNVKRVHKLRVHNTPNKTVFISLHYWW